LHLPFAVKLGKWNDMKCNEKSNFRNASVWNILNEQMMIVTVGIKYAVFIIYN